MILTRGGIFWGVFNFAAVGDVGPDSVMLCETPMFHTVGLIATCRVRALHLRAGTLLLSEGFAPPVTLARLSDAALGVTHFFGVPQIAMMLRNDPAYPASDLSRLKGLFMGGAPLPTALCEALMADGIMVVNGYGMTEASDHRRHAARRGRSARAKMGSTGLPAPAMDIRIADADGNFLPAGATGEVWLRGPAITPGYWNQPEATAKTFHGPNGSRVATPATSTPTATCFLVDRWKDMYISGGENVYPAEVENRDRPSGRGARGWRGGRAGRALGAEVGCAFVVLNPGIWVSAEDVLATPSPADRALQAAPARVEFIEALPRTASGKMRKDELRRSIG